MTTTTMDEPVLEAFLGQATRDAGAALSVLLSHLGDRLGLYAAMADAEPVTPGELARRTGTNERLVREWLSNQAVGGYLTYDPATGRFRLPPEHAAALADGAGPALVQGLFDLVAAVYQSIDKELEVFRTGTGLTWADHHHDLFTATERAFRPGYEAHLVQEWIPGMEGVHDKLTTGARVADVGCGHGVSTMLLAHAYPNSSFVGYDYHAPSVEVARDAAARSGMAGRVRFEVADARDISGTYDLITFFDCWHDTADPLGVAKAARNALADDGAVLAVEPFANDRLEDNASPLGRFGYAISTLVCTPCSVSDGGPGLGAQAGETRTRAIFMEAGFTTFRRIAQTPLNMVYQARA
jgi:SAM-dependent methyltransferase